MSWVGFFFQAEDGIRDKLVTGVQTCALPILEGSGRLFSSENCATRGKKSGRRLPTRRICVSGRPSTLIEAWARLEPRSEERRVGKEGRARGGREHDRENKVEDEALVSSMQAK